MQSNQSRVKSKCSKRRNHLLPRFLSAQMKVKVQIKVKVAWRPLIWMNFVAGIKVKVCKSMMMSTKKEGRGWPKFLKVTTAEQTPRCRVAKYSQIYIAILGNDLTHPKHLDQPKYSHILPFSETQKNRTPRPAWEGQSKFLWFCLWLKYEYKNEWFCGEKILMSEVFWR